MSYETFADPVEELIARLQYQKATGRMLEGWRVLDIPESEIQGLKDFPYVAVFLPTINERYHPGGRMTGGIVNATMNLNLVVAVKRKLGIPELMRATARVLNSCETDTTGKVNSNLGGTVKPFTAQVVNNFVLELSLNSQITITIEPKPYDRGRR